MKSELDQGVGCGVGCFHSFSTLVITPDSFARRRPPRYICPSCLPYHYISQIYCLNNNTAGPPDKLLDRGPRMLSAGKQMRQVLTQNGGLSSPTRWSAEPAIQSHDLSMQWRRNMWCRCRPITKYLPGLGTAPEKDYSLCYMFHMSLQYLLFIQQTFIYFVFSWHRFFFFFAAVFEIGMFSRWRWKR